MSGWRRWKLMLLACVVAFASGCTSNELGRPSWCAPGSASQQLNRAKKYDPYPDPYIAPPILGGRPMGFFEPRQEPDVTKQAQFRQWGYPPNTVPAR